MQRPLNKRELSFIAFYRGNATEAAKMAGYKFPDQIAVRLMKRDKVRKAIEAKQNIAIAESGRSLGRAFEAVNITRNEIINTLATIGLTSKSDSARVSALSKLSDIFRLSPKNINDRDQFDGWTDEELIYLAETGEYPERFRSQLGTSQGAVDGSPKPARKIN